MEIDNLIDELEDILETSTKVPLSGGRIFLNSSEIKRILEDIRLNFPKEIIQAKNIVADRKKIIEDAKIEAHTMIKVAEERIKIMANKNEIVKIAQNNANLILSDAKTKSKEFRNSANEYVMDLIKQMENFMSESLAEIKKAKQSLRITEMPSNN